MRYRVALRTAVLGLLLAGSLAVVLAVRGGSSPRPLPAAPMLRAEGNENRALIRHQGPVPSGSPAVALPDRANAPVDPAFGQPTMVGVQGYGFEEDLRLDPTNPNRIYTSVPDSLSSGTSWIWHSEDGGKTFKWVLAAADKTGKPAAAGGPCAGGGDSELGVDSAGHLYFNDLTLANFSVYRSDDQGATFTCSNAGVPDTVVDRQWYAIDGDPVGGTSPAPSSNSIYLANDEIGPGAPMCGNSSGNNVLVMYRSPIGAIPNASAGLLFGLRQTVTPINTCDEGIMGNNEVSPVATTLNDANPLVPLTDAVRHVYVVHDNAAFNSISMGRCTPVPVTTDPSGLVCTDHLVSSFPTEVTGANFPTMAIDSAGTVYTVWEQAPKDVSGNTLDARLMFSYSTDQANTWASPVEIPMGGLNNEVFAWIGAGDDGKVDISFLGTASHVDPPGPACPLGAVPPPSPKGGPDSILNGIWGLYMVQSLNANSASPTFTAPALAGEHFMHRGSINTVMGGQCRDRTLGDFFQLRIGSQGEAALSYADSNNQDESLTPHAMYVEQVGGSSVYDATPVVSGGNTIRLNSVADVSGDGTYDTAGVSSPNDADLDIVGSSLTRPAAADCRPANTPCYRVTMTMNDLTDVPIPPITDSDQYLQWMTQWLVPASPTCSGGTACGTGGYNFMVYAELDPTTLTYTCYDGQNAALPNGGGIILTYPGVNTLSAAACVANTANAGIDHDTITIDVPIADVSLDTTPLNADRLYTVTASTTTSSVPFNFVPAFAGLGGVTFNLIDVAPGYDAVFGTTAVAVRSFSARAAGRAVVLRWRTGSEVGLAGFNLYRGGLRLNRSLVPAVGDARGHAYVWRGRTAPARHASYRLQLVRTDGARAWFGPART